MKFKDVIITIVCTVLVCLVFGLRAYVNGDVVEKHIKVGYIFVGDASTPYTHNFMKAEKAIEEKYGDKITSVAKYNIAEGTEVVALEELIAENCDVIFTGSYGYGPAVKEFAEKYPDTQFIAATCDNCNTEPKLSNYHTFMGRIYEGRFISGVVAGMKLKEMIDTGVISEDETIIGYVAAFPYAEVISGYTSFFLGVRSIVPAARMNVKYSNTWSDYSLEKKLAEELIDEGCVIISQHSDTTGPAVACENSKKTVYHVGYNQSMTDVAASTSLISCRINWEPYMMAAVDAVASGQNIEETIDAKTNGTDAWAGFDKGWVEMLDLNKVIAAEGTEEAIKKKINKFRNNDMQVFYGNYTGTNPFDADDVIDLGNGYTENSDGSSPSFSYVLDDVIYVTQE